MLQSQLIAGQPERKQITDEKIYFDVHDSELFARGRRSPAASRNRHVGTRWLSLALVAALASPALLWPQRVEAATIPDPNNPTSQFQVEGTQPFTPGTTLPS